MLVQSALVMGSTVMTPKPFEIAYIASLRQHLRDSDGAAGSRARSAGDFG